MTRPYLMPRSIPRHAEQYFESLGAPEPASDLAGLSHSMTTLVLWSRHTRRALPRLFQPVFRALALGLCFLWFAWEEIGLWIERLDWRHEQRILGSACWACGIGIAILLTFDGMLWLYTSSFTWMER